jgi:hypothetical protein
MVPCTLSPATDGYSGSSPFKRPFKRKRVIVTHLVWLLHRRTEWLQKWHAFSHEWNAKQITTWNRFTTWAVDDRSRAYVLNPTTCEWDALGNSADQWPISGLAATSNDEPWALVTDQPGSTAV